MSAYGPASACGTCGRHVAATEPFSRGMCDTCYRRTRYREKRDGTFVPTAERQQRRPRKAVTRKTRPLADRLLDRVQPGWGGCWIFTGTVNQDGYGHFKVGGRIQRAHRVSYETFVGEIPTGLVLDHLCRIRRCIRPDHLEAVTDRTNLRRSPFTRPSINALVTHCPQGHEYDLANTYITRRGSRSCRKCNSAASAASKAKRRARQHAANRHEVTA